MTKHQGQHRAQVHFPPLSADEALLVANLLDRVVTALWRAHGHAMADLLRRGDSADAKAAPDSPSKSPLPADEDFA